VTGGFLERLQDECGGVIPFDRFMEAALYHPDLGYYTKRIRTVGARGDFSTWPGIHSSLARAITSWLKTAFEYRDRDTQKLRAGFRWKRRHVIEVGAGTGRLAAGVLGRLGYTGRWRMTYHIVEVSPVLREEQKKLLRGRKVVWHEDLAEALDASGGEADIFSNELPDAFPCRVFVRSAGSWMELALRIDGNSAREVLLHSELPSSSALQAHPPEGSRVEVHESYRKWMAAWVPHWKAGRMLTVDYGGPMPGLYHRRPAGTLRAYAHHQRLQGPDVYAAFGCRDITADVNWRTGFRGNLTSFLEDQSPGITLPDALRRAGEAFHVLGQSPAGMPARTSG
jgi:SAM-dependent MidA family methyltransferase